jgi:O-antigen/teichoic acid export membrane protein
MEAEAQPVALTPPRVSAGLIRKNLLSVAFAYGGGALAGVAAQAVLGRELGRSTFGEYIAAFSLLTVLAVAFELGPSDYLVREAAREPARLPAVIADVVGLRLLASAAVVGLALAAAAALGFSGRELAVTAVMAAMFVANALSTPFRAGLQAIERLELASVISVANAMLSAAGMIALVLAGYGLVAAVAFSAAVSVAAIGVSWRTLARFCPVSLHWSAVRMRRAVRASVPFTAVNVGIFATTYADALVVRGVLGAAATGAYGAAYRVFMVIQFIPSIYVDAVYRTLAHLAGAAPARFARLVERSAAALLVLGLPFAFGGAPLASQLVQAVFGHGFAPAAGAFRVLLVSLPISFPLWVLTIALLVTGRQRTAAVVFALAFAANVAANIVLVRRFGIVAAAWITLATNAGLVIAASATLRGAGVTLRWLVLGMRALPAAVATGAVAFALRHEPLPVPLVAGALVYVAGLELARVRAALGLPSLRRAFVGGPG